MDKKVVLVTGATGGIGKAAALALAKQHFTVIIHGRNRQKIENVRDEIKAASDNQNIDILVADLFLLAEVRKMAHTFQQQYNRLDILINNAGGIMGNLRETTSEGIEKTIAVNLLSPFLLTNQLLPALQNSNDARIINVASNAHQLAAKPNFRDIQLQANYRPLRAYGNAKLFLIWVSQHLDAQLKAKGIHNVSVNTMHPGAVATNFGVASNLGGLLNLVGKLARPFLRSAEAGADTLVYLASTNTIPGKGGSYFVNRKPAKVSTRYYSPENEQIIWEFCNSIIANVYR